MRRRLWIALALCAAAAAGAIGCGQAAGSLQLSVDQAGLTDAAPVGGYVISFAQSGAVTDCSALWAQNGCVNDLLGARRVPIHVGANGKDAPAVRIDPVVQLDGGQANAEELEVPIGVDYTLLIEAFGTDSPPHLVASSCKLHVPVSTGSNAIVAEPFHLYADGGVPCDPTRGAQ